MKKNCLILFFICLLTVLANGQNQKQIKLNSKASIKLLSMWKTDSLGFQGERWKIFVKYDFDSFVNKLNIESLTFHFGNPNKVDTIMSDQNQILIYQYITYQKANVKKVIDFEFKQVNQKYLLYKINRKMYCG